ncbi:hypothetical protein V498_06184 [Pseudogymnoascus sp. VKM F-4517 (FW-2822)]|nr:hypothetical protein V498_06184 [Pseudogymnoascus sp. VKM F-4517 (FW-2822)]
MGISKLPLSARPSLEPSASSYGLIEEEFASDDYANLLTLPKLSPIQSGISTSKAKEAKATAGFAMLLKSLIEAFSLCVPILAFDRQVPHAWPTNIARHANESLYRGGGREAPYVERGYKEQIEDNISYEFRAANKQRDVRLVERAGAVGNDDLDC